MEQIRGVDSSSAVNSLVVRDLVEEAGRLELPDVPSPTGPLPIFCGASGCRAWMIFPTSQRAAQAQEQLEQLSLTPADGQGEEP